MAARKKSRASRSRTAKGRSAGVKRKTGAARGRASAGAKKKAAKKKAVRKKAAKRTVRRRTAAPRPARRRAAPRGAAASPAALPNGIGFRIQHMDYTTHALEEVRRFYTEQLGFKEFTFDAKMSYLAVTTGPSSSIGFMPPMPGPPEQWQPPREPSIYLIVEDVDRAHRDLAAKGVPFEQAPTTMPWGHRTAVLRDPEGRMVCLAQILEGA